MSFIPSNSGLLILNHHVSTETPISHNSPRTPASQITPPYRKVLISTRFHPSSCPHFREFHPRSPQSFIASQATQGSYFCASFPTVPAIIGCDPCFEVAPYHRSPNNPVSYLWYRFYEHLRLPRVVTSFVVTAAKAAPENVQVGNSGIIGRSGNVEAIFVTWVMNFRIQLAIKLSLFSNRECFQVESV